MSQNQLNTGKVTEKKTETVSRKAGQSQSKKGENPTLFNRIKPHLIPIIALLIFFAVAFFLRVFFVFDKVFTDIGIIITSNDGYYFMRQVDNLVQNFPNFTQADPYVSYPLYNGRVEPIFFVWLIASISWLFGLGSPSPQLVDTIGVLVPPILGALTVIPAYFIGKALFSRWAGILAAGLMALMPGEFMGRSILGFTDQHVAESLFTAVMIMFLLMAIKKAKVGGLTLAHVRKRDYSIIKKPIVFSLLAGFTMWLYIFTWQGALLFGLITFAFFAVQLVIDHLKRQDSGYLAAIGVIFYGVSLLLTLLLSVSQLTLISLAIALIGVPVLYYFSLFMSRKKVALWLYPVVVILGAAAGLGMIFVINASLFNSIIDAFQIFFPSGAQLTTVEMQPLISLSYANTYGSPLALVWGNYNISFFLAIIGIAIILYQIIRKGEADKTLLLIWSVIILLATLGQRRFGYYLAVNIALLSSFVCWWLLDKAVLQRIAASTAQNARILAARARRGEKQPLITINHIVVTMSVLIIFFGVYFWNIEPAIKVASRTPYAPSKGWVTSMNWLRENSPEPLEEGAYNKVYQPLQRGEYFSFPESAYGVLAWWDYGYWISRIAHRLPNSNPSQDPESIKNVAAFFTATSEADSAEARQKLDSKYVVLDHETPLGKFWAIATWAGEEPDTFAETYLNRESDGRYHPAMLYYPEYYRSMAARLYNFEGQAVTPEKTMVVTYTVNKDEKGAEYKIIQDIKEFETFAAAEEFVAEQESGNHKIVGTHPLKSPVALEALENYSLVYSSGYTETLNDGTSVPQVKIFEYKE